MCSPGRHRPIFFQSVLFGYGSVTIQVRGCNDINHQKPPTKLKNYGIGTSKKNFEVRRILARLSYCVKWKVQLEDVQSSRLVAICLEAYVCARCHITGELK